MAHNRKPERPSGMGTKATLGIPQVQDAKIKGEAETHAFLRGFARQWRTALDSLGAAVTTDHLACIGKLFLLCARPRGTMGKQWGLSSPVGEGTNVFLSAAEASKVLGIERSRGVLQGMIRLCASIHSYYQGMGKVLREEILLEELSSLRQGSSGYGGWTHSSLQKAAKADPRLSPFFKGKTKDSTALGSLAYNKLSRIMGLLMLSPNDLTLRLKANKGGLQQADAGFLLITPAQVESIRDRVNEALARVGQSQFQVDAAVLNACALDVATRARAKAEKKEKGVPEVSPSHKALDEVALTDLVDDIQAILAASKGVEPEEERAGAEETYIREAEEIEATV